MEAEKDEGSKRGKEVKKEGGAEVNRGTQF